MPLGVKRVAQRSDHVLPRLGFRGHVRQRLLEAFAFHGSAVAVQQSGIQQQLHHLGNAASVVQIHRHVTAAGFEITDHRHALTDALEVVDAQIHAGRAGNGQQMQHGIGGTTHGHDHADGVFEGLFGEQIERADIGFHRLHQHFC